MNNIFLKNLKVEQLQEMLENIEKNIAQKNWRSSGYFDMKRQAGEIRNELKVRKRVD